MIPTVYINLEDDVAKIIARIKKEKSKQLVLVCPKKCQLFSDIINLKLLKKQIDALEKTVFILTMDEKGQAFALSSGFLLKTLPKAKRASNFSDISLQPKFQPSLTDDVLKKNDSPKIEKTLKTVASFVSNFAKSEKNYFENKKVVNENYSEGNVKNVVVEDASLADQRKTQKNISKVKILVFSLFLFALITTLVLVFFILPKGEVIIFPKHESITRNYNVKADVNQKNLDSENFLIPAYFHTKVYEVSRKFKSEGKRDVGNKAIGNVKIYNFTGQPINLKAQTTTITAGNKSYVLSQDAMQVKPTKYLNEKTKEIDESDETTIFEINAVNGGEDFNLPIGMRMEISNQIFGSRPQLLFAKTTTAISGGTSRFLSFVSAMDINNSRDEIGKYTIQMANQDLLQQNFKLVEGAYKIEIQDFKTDKQEGFESPSFEVFAKVKIEGIAIDYSSLKEMIIDRVLSTLPDKRTFSDESINFSVGLSDVDLNNKFANLSLRLDADLAPNIDIKELKQSLKSMEKAKAVEYFSNLSNVEKAEIILIPSWQNSFPRFASKIYINLEK